MGERAGCLKPLSRREVLSHWQVMGGGGSYPGPVSGSSGLRLKPKVEKACGAPTSGSHCLPPRSRMEHLSSAHCWVLSARYSPIRPSGALWLRGLGAHVSREQVSSRRGVSCLWDHSSSPDTWATLAPHPHPRIPGVSSEQCLQGGERSVPASG